MSYENFDYFKNWQKYACLSKHDKYVWAYFLEHNFFLFSFIHSTLKDIFRIYIWQSLKTFDIKTKTWQHFSIWFVGHKWTVENDLCEFINDKQKMEYFLKCFEVESEFFKSVLYLRI